MKNENIRLKRARRTRAKIAELNITRLTVHRSNSNIYAQIIDGKNNKVIAAASTLEVDVKKNLVKNVLYLRMDIALFGKMKMSLIKKKEE